MNYIELNRDSWNKRTGVHVQSDFYGVKDFLAGQSTLNSIELDLLGDLQGKNLLHLQCHFGMDTLSLARLGARVTGIDLSDAAIDQARQLAEQQDIPASFICCNIYDLPEHLDEQFDVVFTSYGTIGWLPDLDAWGKIVARYLKPGGLFVFAEFHPAVWMFDNDFTKIEYSYFQQDAIVETEKGTYTDRDADIETTCVSWNHSLDQVFRALLHNGLRITDFREFDYSPYNCFANTVETEPGRFHIRGMEGKLPMVYALQAVRNTVPVTSVAE
ncbi:MAG: methyltransferase domain-containing protein [Saprospiraceae bacterium]|jgi:2-polyprenyl-3-methyl-5-hydroxy-6-metoxy-1,4-benzoquinol methylase|nr:methyltransferase domain-containing protein [Saprospiraceae bacterium]